MRAAPSAAELAMDRVLPEVWLDNVPFTDAVARVAKLAGIEIVLALDAAAAIELRPVTVRARNQTLDEVLSEMLSGRNRDASLGCRPDGGRIVIADESALDAHPLVRCYDVAHLLGPPDFPLMQWVLVSIPTFDTSSDPGADLAIRPAALRELLMASVAVDSWRVNGGPFASMHCVGSRLVVVQTWAGQREIQKTLVELTRRRAPLKPDEPTGPAVVVELWNDELGRFVPQSPDKADAALRRTVPELSLDAVTLAEAVDELRRTWRADIVLQGPILVDADARVSVRVRNASLAAALTAVANGRAWPEPLGYGVREGLIVVSTKSQTDAMTFSRVYDVRDLFAAHAAADPAAERWAISDGLKAAIEEQVAPDTWRPAGGSIFSPRELAGHLLITQTWENHEAIARLLSDLRRNAAQAPPDARPASNPATERRSP